MCLTVFPLLIAAKPTDLTLDANEKLHVDQFISAVTGGVPTDATRLCVGDAVVIFRSVIF